MAASAGARPALAQAEAAFRQAIAVAKQAESALQEALAASELKRLVLDRTGRSEEEGVALIAEASRGLDGTAEEVARALAPRWL